MFKKGTSISFWGIAIALVLVLTACSPTTTTRVGGIVQGIVYSDLNGNGVIDSDEIPIEGAIVSLSGCGSILTQTTSADGAFSFTNLPEGSCLITATENGWVFSGSDPSLGYPVPVTSNPDAATSINLALAPVTAYYSTPFGSPSPEEYATETMTPSATETTTITPTETSTQTPTDTPTLTPTYTGTSTQMPPVVVWATTQDVNCRVGPTTAWLSVGALKKGQYAAILGTNETRTWWVIDNSFYEPGTTCWVSGAVTDVAGDIFTVPVYSTPKAWVTLVQISTDQMVYGTCGRSHSNTFKGIITANGPTKVTYHWEIYTTSGILLKQTSDETITFSAYGTEYVGPISISVDCGDYYTQLVITSPNLKSKVKFWSVVSE